jgi:hypothetical protein
MPSAAGPETVQQRLTDLEAHLEQENPILLKAVQSFRTLDRVAYDMGCCPTTSPSRRASPGGR